MAVLLETSKGDMVVDLHTDDCPIASRNFLKLCKIKYYNNCLFHNVQQNFIAQTGDPTGTGRGGDSIYGIMYGPQARFFEDEIRPHLRHKKKGTLGMASGGENLNASQFYVTTGADLDSLDDKHTVFGEISEGLDVLAAIDAAFVDAAGRPLQNVRIRHTIVLDDPFDDPQQLAEHIPDASPAPAHEQGDRLEDDWVPTDDGRSLDEIEEAARKREAAARAVVLEMIGDLPEADAKPPSDMLFVCKLNPVTTEEDLEIIFSRFGTVTSCDVIRDFKTGDSLNYAFLGFDSERACEEAYFKMNNCLIDDRRIKVDFSQSVYHLWKQFRRFGRAGGAAEAAAAADVAGDKGGGKGGGGAKGAPRLELKPGAGGLYAGPAGRGGGGGSHGLLLDVDDQATPREANGNAGPHADAPAGGSGRARSGAHEPRHAPAAVAGGRRDREHDRGREDRAERVHRDSDRHGDRDRERDGDRDRRGGAHDRGAPRERGREGQGAQKGPRDHERGGSDAGAHAGAEPLRHHAVEEQEGSGERRRQKEHKKDKKHKKEQRERGDERGDKRRRHD